MEVSQVSVENRYSYQALVDPKEISAEWLEIGKAPSNQHFS